MRDSFSSLHRHLRLDGRSSFRRETGKYQTNPISPRTRRKQIRCLTLTEPDFAPSSPIRRVEVPQAAGSVPPPGQTNLFPISTTWPWRRAPGQNRRIAPLSVFSRTNPILLATRRKRTSYLLPTEPDFACGPHLSRIRQTAPEPGNQ
jgi:hypothetical protein